jgi:hypothetical protein
MSRSASLRLPPVRDVVAATPWPWGSDGPRPGDRGAERQARRHAEALRYRDFLTVVLYSSQPLAAPGGR